MCEALCCGDGVAVAGATVLCCVVVREAVRVRFAEQWSPRVLS
jgi:hypothetical protein